MRKTLTKTKFKINENGITLIALVITIIVLLILAGVAISMLSGENGILKQAAEAKEENTRASIAENIKLAVLSARTVGKGKIEGKEAIATLNEGLKEIGASEIENLPANIETELGIFTVLENGELIKPVKNPYNLNGWEFAYAIDGTTWSEKIEAGNLANGKIIAKFYNNNKLINEKPTYTVVIEGQGEIPEYDETSAWYSDVDNENIYITECIVCEGITSIGEWGFSSCKKLEKVQIAATVTTIKEGAFEYCNSLESVIMPNVTIIGINAFQYCSSLESVIIPNVTTIGRSAFQSCNKLVDIKMPNVTSIGGYVFKNCSSLKSVEMDKITTLEEMFEGCTKLENVKCPNLITTVGYTFRNCIGLKSIELPKVTDIGVGTFFGCTSLKSIEMPNVTKIGETAFQFCTSLSHINIPNVKTIGNNAFYNAGLKTIVVRDVESIGVRALGINGSLTDVYYGGTEEEWQNVEGNSGILSARIHYNYDI